jgi:hypothetical protein
MAATLGDSLRMHLGQLQGLTSSERLKQRYAKFRSYGQVLEKAPTPPALVESAPANAVAGSNGTPQPNA